MATRSLDAREALPGTLGSADARIDAVGHRVAGQSPDGSDWQPAGEGGTRPQVERAHALLRPGSRLLPYGRGAVSYPAATGRRFVEVVEVDLRDRVTSGMFVLERGRPPAAPGEIAVSAAMARLGAQIGESVPYVRGKGPARVVGILGRTPNAVPPTVVGLPGDLLPPEQGGRSWLVDQGGHPVTWEDVRRLNEAGFLVHSRAVILDPPPDASGPFRPVRPEQSVQGALVATLIVLEVVLLAGPAFAVGLRRRRRQLALVAAQGGSARQLRLVVLAEGLILGVGAALLGVAGGVGLAAAGVALTRALGLGLDGDLPIWWFAGAGPFEVPWEIVVPTAVLGVASGVVAALVPAVQAARQDVAAVLGGREHAIAARYRAARAIPGALLAVAGVAGTVAAIRAESLVWIAVAALLTQAGLITLTPWLVAAAGRLAGRLPLPLRLSVRDASRHRTRTACAVAAVMTAATAMSATAITFASENAMLRDGYTRGVPVGTTVIDTERVPEKARAAVTAAVRRELPGVRPVEVYRGRDAAGGPVRLALTRADCESRCDDTATGPHGGDLPIGDERLLRLVQGRDDPAASAAFAEGRAVVFDRRLVRDGALTVDLVADRKGERRPVTVPAVVASAADPRHAVAVLPPAAVRGAGLGLEPGGLLVDPAEHRVDPATEVRLRHELSAVHERAFAYVERGFPDGTPAMLLAVTIAAAVVILGAAFAVTGLAAADLRPDLATMAAVGAAPRLRRLVVAGQALFISGLGVLVGLAAGLAAGTAAVWSLAAGPAGAGVRYRVVDGFVAAVAPHTPLVEVPWPYLATVVAGLPVLAALVAGVFTRTPFTPPRRLT